MKRYIIGRSRSADISIGSSHDTVSGRHLEVQEEQGGFSIRDLGSPNGTSVRSGREWEAVTGWFSVDLGTEIQLGEYVTSLSGLGFREVRESPREKGVGEPSEMPTDLIRDISPEDMIDEAIGGSGTQNSTPKRSGTRKFVRNDEGEIVEI